MWLKIRQALQKNVSHLEHTLETAGQNPDKIGAAFKRMASELPLLKELVSLQNQIDQGRVLSHAEFIQIKRITANQLISISQKPHSDLQAFAALEALRLISPIETRVEFPKTKEDIQKEVQKKKEEKEKEKKKDEKDDKDQEEEDPEWNKTTDKYNPENKDLANDSKGKKKKNVDIVLTDVNVYKRLLRQKIYDQFNLKDWSSVPVQREQTQYTNQFTKKLIINPLGETVVDVPVPYGYTLIPGKYADHKIAEVGPGEFKVQVSSKNPVTLGLARITNEPHLPTQPKPINHQELNFWPQHLLLFAQSLKGLPPLEAATRLEKYISEEGGFLYYSKGDKISEGDLTKIDQRFNQLLTQMPKPMAMAQVGAFNCDGAAWIGALLLRDVLNIPVRIAGGRTSAGTKMVNQETLHVVKSADPAHAWVEVHDGKHWVPFDMTPKNNTPDSQSSPTDVDREEPAPKDQKDQKNQKQQPPKDNGQPSKGKGEGKEKKDSDKDGAKDAAQDSGKDDKKEGKDSKDKQDGNGTEGKKKEQDQDGEGAPGSKKIDDILNTKSTQRKKGEQNQALIDRVLKRNELMLLEHLIHDGYQTSFQAESHTVLDALSENSNWKNQVERSRGKISTLLNDSKFVKFSGLQNSLSEVRVEFSQNNAREGKQKLMAVQRLLLALSEYRSLTKQETEALHSIEGIVRSLDQIKHQNSKEYDAVQELLKNLPGHISKSWLAKQYGKDYDQLGTLSNNKLAQDIVAGKLKPLLQMAAVNEFVDMTLNSTPEPQWKDEPTLNRSYTPKPRQDLVITRSPLDFAKMLWTLRPGEHMFAPTLQGRQFAIGSLETRRVINPKNPLERKVSVIYYDVSPSMNGHPIESQDALLMAFVDKALSETDAIGRPTHEIYLIPFNDNLLQGVHVAAREDAQNFLSRRMTLRTQTSGGTDIQKAVENFYELIATSYKNKSAQGREKLFKKANMVLFTDGGSAINMEQLEAKRKTIPSGVEINMNFVSIGDQVNETLKTLSQNAKLSSNKPTFRKMDSQMIDSVANISAEYNPDAFATNERITGSMLSQINTLLQKIGVDPRQQGDQGKIDHAISQVQTTKTDISQLSGIREALNLTQLQTVMSTLKLDPHAKQRLVESVIESYQQLTGRSWRDMTYPEKDALEKLRAWARHQ
ncbi:MAG: hypothetical protein SGI74_10380 [Oligoflexia bacterium]|nr:hypothetical protein [Oligoflexia bacterium]